MSSGSPGLARVGKGTVSRAAAHPGSVGASLLSVKCLGWGGGGRVICVLLFTPQRPRLGESSRKEVYLAHRFEGPGLRDASGVILLAKSWGRASYHMVRGGVYERMQTCSCVSVSSSLYTATRTQSKVPSLIAKPSHFPKSQSHFPKPLYVLQLDYFCLMEHPRLNTDRAQEG